MAINKLETKRLLLKGRKFDSDTGVFEGYASVFGNIDSDGDVVEKGAYADFLAGDWSRVKILVLHNDQWLPIGKPVEMYEDDIGLYMKAKISDTSMGQDVRQLLKDGVLDELSIGYVVIDYYMDTDGIRHLAKLELQEVSIVTWAANDQAKILAVKSRFDKSAGGSAEALLCIAGILEQQAAEIRLHASGMQGKACVTGTRQKPGEKEYQLPAVLLRKSKGTRLPRRQRTYHK